MRSPLRALAAPFGWLNRKLPWLFAPFRLVTLPFRWLWGRWRALVVFFTEVPEDVSLTDTLGEALESRDTLKETLAGIGEHLDVLRRQLFRALLALVLTTGLSLNFADRLMALLAAPLGDEAQTRLLSLAQRLGGDFQAVLAAPPGGEQFDVIRRASTEILNQLLQLGADGMTRLQVIEPTESIGVFMRVSLLVGIALAMPWLVLELYLFIAPGLMPRSRQLLFLALPAASLLFLLGLLFTYLIMLPAAIPFLYTFAGFRAAWRPSAYFNLVTGLMFWIGVAFQMPLIIYALAAAGWIRARHLLAQWRLAVVVIAIIAAAVTPTVDPVNMGLVMIPMILLYFFSIAGAWVAQTGRRREIEKRAAQMKTVKKIPNPEIQIPKETP